MAAIDVIFFQYSKRLNSTAQPALSAGTRLECIFREGFDVLNPELQLDLRANNDYQNPFRWNYCYIPTLQRYYWIRDWAFDGGMWLCGTDEDLLASHKTAIGNCYIYAQRLADRLDNGSVRDGGISDSMIPTVASPSWAYNRASGSTFVKSLASGCYVIGVINPDPDAVGSVSYYALTPTQFKTFRSGLMGGSWINSTAEMSVDTQKAILNPIQYVTSCMWFPFDISHIYDVSTGVHGMSLGWWTLSSVGYFNIRADGMYRFYVNISIPVHPQYAATQQRMLRCAPFSTYLLHLPYFGSLPVDYEDFSSGTIGALFEIDIISGKGSVQLYNGSISAVSDFPALRMILQTSCQVATPIQLSQVVSDTWAAQVTELQTAATMTSLRGSMAQRVIGVIGQVGGEMLKYGAAGAGAGSVVPGAGTAAGAIAGAAVGLGAGIASAVVHGKTTSVSMDAASEAGLYSSFSAAAPRVTSQGANGSILGSWCPIEISGKFLLLSTTAADIYARCGYAAGWPTYIHDHTGYVQGLLSDFHSSGVLKIEAEAIKAQIEAGLYYE